MLNGYKEHHLIFYSNLTELFFPETREYEDVFKGFGLGG